MDGLVVLWEPEPEPDFFAGAGAGKMSHLWAVAM